MEDRIDTIFCKMLKYNSASLGCTDSPYIITKDIIQAGLVGGTPPIMKYLSNFFIA